MGTTRVQARLTLAMVFVAAACAGVLLTVPRIPQPLHHHALADTRVYFGVPNFFDVFSNMPFAIVGGWGLAIVFRRRRQSPFSTPSERWPYAVLFGGVLLTASGSAYYHLAPDNARLVWDRLPMAIGFMGLLASVAGERLGVRASRVALVPLVILGVTSVVWWYWTEVRGVGDLRPYLLVQFGSLVAVAVLLAGERGAYGGDGYVAGALAFYVAAKAFELADHQIFSMTNAVSGHTLKHLAAAAGVACLLAMLRSRLAACVYDSSQERRETS